MSQEQNVERPAQPAPPWPNPMTAHDEPSGVERVAAVLAEHRLTFWSVYHWKDGGWSAAPRCTCGVLWSAGDQDDPLAQIARHEAHVAAALAEAGIGDVRGLRRTISIIERVQTKLKERAERAEVKVARVEVLAESLTEQGDEHVSGCMGQADCAACVYHDLRAALSDPDATLSDRDDRESP